jgi:gamma-glutamylcyclotransferase (GGCT)/AIG2-like uncharacterized protein YtfP
MADLCRLFVYGTLKPGERAFDRFCRPYAIAVEPAQVRGRLYHLSPGYPAMTLEPGGWVRGVVLRFQSEMPLTPIDRFEDYDPERPDRSEYSRLQLPTYSLDEQPLGVAWVYVMQPARVAHLLGQWLPEGHWSEGASA